MSAVPSLPSTGEIVPRILLRRDQRAFVRLHEMASTHDAAQGLMHGAQRLLRDGRERLFDQWCLAEMDLALMLNRVLANGGGIPDWAATYLKPQSAPPSVQDWVACARPDLHA